MEICWFDDQLLDLNWNFCKLWQPCKHVCLRQRFLNITIISIFFSMKNLYTIWSEKYSFHLIIHIVKRIDKNTFDVLILISTMVYLSWYQRYWPINQKEKNYRWLPNEAWNLLCWKDHIISNCFPRKGKVRLASDIFIVEPGFASYCKKLYIFTETKQITLGRVWVFRIKTRPLFQKL